MDAEQPEGGLSPFDRPIVKMLGIVSHEIRGPLISVMAGMKLVLHGSYGAMDVGVAGKIHDLHARLTQLLGTADDFLEKACCMEDGLVVQHESLNLVDDILAVVLDEFSDEMRARRIAVDRLIDGLPPDAVLAASRRGMKIVFRNLIRNALTHGGMGCSIVCGYQDHPEHHRMNVYNSGTPIPRECRERLFTKFGALGSPAGRHRTGLGLGLFLSREIVRFHGGAIWYEDHPGGSDFVFTLPKTPVRGGGPWKA